VLNGGAHLAHHLVGVPPQFPDHRGQFDRLGPRAKDSEDFFARLWILNKFEENPDIVANGARSNTQPPTL
jgi:hypothetical protein